jgi:hypothetical protein
VVMSQTGARCMLLAVVLTVPAMPQASAQSVGSKGSAPRPNGVHLIVRPRVGDTLRLQMEQTTEVSRRPAPAQSTRGSKPVDGSRSPTDPRASSSDYGPRRDRAIVSLTRLILWAHSLVEASDLTVTTLLATTDSIAMWAGTPAEAAAPQMMQVPQDGREVRVRVTPDGAIRVKNPPPAAMELSATLSSIPGMLPQEALQVGDRWERDIVLPSIPLSGYRTDGVIRATFRFDSLSRGGREAWISLEGSLQRDRTTRDLPAGTRMITAGTMRGSLVVDRHLAWITDARTVIDVQSEVTGATPTILDFRITQRIRAR